MRTTQSFMKLGAALLLSTPLHAADWTHEITPYLWGAGLEGTTAVGPVSADVDAALGGDAKGPADAVKADVDIDQLILEGDFGYALTESLHGFVGLRYVDLETKVTVKGLLDDKRSVQGRADWVDPVIGLYYIRPFSDRWSLSLRGDIGGFGIGSESDYDEGKGADYFKYDMSMQGPALGAVFTFH